MVAQFSSSSSSCSLMNCDSEDKSALTERYIALVPELISAVWPGPSPNSKHRLRHCVITLFRCLVELVRLVKDVRVTTHALQGSKTAMFVLTTLKDFLFCW